MSKKPGRKPAENTYRANKSQLSSDARIIIALIKNQPLTKQEICQKTNISEQTFYRKTSILSSNKITKVVEQQKYALWDFDPLETQIQNAFIELFKPEGSWYVTQDHVASEIAVPWQQIETLTLEVAKKLDCTIILNDEKYEFYKSGVIKP